MADARTQIFNNPAPFLGPGLVFKTRIFGDLAGALSASVISLPVALAYGMAAFAALGDGFRPTAALIGLNASVFAAMVSALLGGMPGIVSGPPASTTIIIGSVVTLLAAQPVPPLHAAAAVVAVVSACILIGGLIQVVLGLAGAGNIVKYIPHPVIAGFLNGIALLLIRGQIQPLAGFHPAAKFMQMIHEFNRINAASLLIGCCTLGAILLSRKFLRVFPPYLLGLFAGCATYAALALSVPRIAGKIPCIGSLSLGVPAPTAFSGIVHVRLANISTSVMVQLLFYSIILGLLGSMESLMCATALENLTGRRHNSKKELIGQGIGNLTGSLFGSLFSAGSIIRSTTNYNSGGRGKLSGALSSALVLLLFLTSGRLIGRIPLAVFAGILIHIGIGLFDKSCWWMFKAFAGGRGYRRDIANSLLINFSVAILTMSINLLAAIGFGVAISAAYFIAKIGPSVIHHTYGADEHGSNRVRGERQTRWLRENGHRIRVFVLQGPVFFGSADRLDRVIESQAENISFCILDMKRVNDIDATGANILAKIHRRLNRNKNHLLISHLDAKPALLGFLAASGPPCQLPNDIFYEDTDAALEWAEERLLTEHRLDYEDRELKMEQLDLMAGLTSEELVIVSGRLEKVLFKKGERILQEGGNDRDLYILTSGLVSIVMNLSGSNRSKRLFTLSCGALLGEVALIDGSPRSADVLAIEDSVLYRLTHANFEYLLLKHPQISVKLLKNIASTLSCRLRIRSHELSILESN